MGLADWVKRERIARGWSQQDLAEHTNGELTRGYISNLESSAMVEPKAGVFLALSKAFRVPLSAVYEGAGLFPPGRPLPKESYQDLLDRARLLLPLRVPVYTLQSFGKERNMQDPLYDLHLSPELVPDGHRVVGYHITEREIAVVDHDSDVEVDDDVVCVTPRGVTRGRMRRIDGELWLEDDSGHCPMEQCASLAPVLMIVTLTKRQSSPAT